MLFLPFHCLNNEDHPRENQFKDFFDSRENLLPDDDPGVSPCSWGPPVVIMLYYPDQDFLVTLRNHMRPRPQRGQGWRKGGFKFSKKDFYRADFFKTVF
jgi:hypothetical protein